MDPPTQMISLWHAMLSNSILPSRERLSKLDSVLSKPAVLHQQSPRDILNLCCHFNSFAAPWPGDAISRHPFLRSSLRGSPLKERVLSRGRSRSAPSSPGLPLFPPPAGTPFASPGSSGHPLGWTHVHICGFLCPLLLHLPSPLWGGCLCLWYIF